MTGAALNTKDMLQLGVSIVAPFVAAGGALWIYALQQRERVSCFITYGYGREYDEIDFLGIHNRSSQPIAVVAVRYRSGVLVRKSGQGTALNYEDPTDLAFPYVVGPGEIRKLWLDDVQALRLAKSVGFLRRLMARLLHRSRILVECETSTGARYATSAEKVLPWELQ